MKIVTWNVNGIRAAERNGLLDWIEREQPDVLCLQEIKAEEGQLSEALTAPAGYQTYWHPATSKKGYSGVAVWTKVLPQSVQIGIGNPEVDSEGRIIVVTYEDFILYNIYFPNGARDHSRVPFKLALYAHLLDRFDALHSEGKKLVICGDFNIAHERIDLTNPTANAKTTGFLPEEREWITSYLQHGLSDVFRDRHPETTGAYTWWSYRPGVRDKNIGWRIDYFLVSTDFTHAVTNVYHQQDVKGSDHCPVVLELAAN